MYCFLGLIGTLVMGILGREAWNDARAWRNLFSWSTAGPSGQAAWPSGTTNRCNSGNSLACRDCPVHRA